MIYHIYIYHDHFLQRLLFIFSSGKKWVLGKSWDLGLSHPQTHPKRAPNKIMGRGESMSCSLQLPNLFCVSANVINPSRGICIHHGTWPVTNWISALPFWGIWGCPSWNLTNLHPSHQPIGSDWGVYNSCPMWQSSQTDSQKRNISWKLCCTVNPSWCESSIHNAAPSRTFLRFLTHRCRFCQVFAGGWSFLARQHRRNAFGQKLVL